MVILFILAFRDSWFWYPHNNLLNPINRFSKQATILFFGANGAQATQLATGFLAQFKSAVKGYGAASMVMLSAGGNDFAGFYNLQKILLPISLLTIQSIERALQKCCSHTRAHIDPGIKQFECNQC